MQGSIDNCKFLKGCDFPFENLLHGFSQIFRHTQLKLHLPTHY
jgi:hypothetical protein